MVNGLILAGAPNSGRLKDASPAPVEAVIQVAGRPLVDFVVDAMVGARQVEQLVVVGPAQYLGYLTAQRPGVRLVDAAGELVENLVAGLETLPGDQLAVVATADIPLLTGPIVDGFVAQCLAQGDYDFYYTVVPKDVIMKKFPGARRSWINLQERAVTGGNLFMVRPAVALAVKDELIRVTELRKNELGLALMLGPGLLLKYLFGRLTLPEAENRVCSHFHIRGRAVVVEYPEIGVDVDKPADLGLVESILASGGFSPEAGQETAS